MDNNKMRGKQSIELDRGVYIMSSASVAGKKEGEGPLGDKFDIVCDDPMLGQDSWELAESTMQKKAAQTALEKAGLSASQLRYIFAGDLLGQLIATSFGLETLDVPLFGLFGACSTCGESLALGAMTICGGYADYVMSLTSSHFGSAEKQFRFPLEYGNQRPLSATWTVTGSGAFILSGKRGKVRSVHFVRKKREGADQWNNHGKDRGLWREGFSEYGSSHGAGCLSGNYSEF